MILGRGAPQLDVRWELTAARRMNCQGRGLEVNAHIKGRKRGLEVNAHIKGRKCGKEDEGDEAEEKTFSK